VRAAALGLSLLLAACGSKNEEERSEPAPPPSATPAGPPIDADPVRAQYERLLDALPSPCGRGRSLRAAMQRGSGCVRGRFAAKYVELMLDGGPTDDQLTIRYEDRYVYPRRPVLTLDDAPRLGPEHAPLELVAFLDYGCKPCRWTAKMLDELREQYDGTIAVYYKQYPLVGARSTSMAAAQAALAAHRQGRYRAMHDQLFAHQGAHAPADLRRYARAIGLEMDRFERDFAAAAPAVRADLAQGEAAELARTPSLIVGGKVFTDLGSRALLTHWIEEELAVLAAAAPATSAAGSPAPTP
jgi:protein-disulfide isomerase